MPELLVKILTDKNCWHGSLTGLLGAYLLAQNDAFSGYGFVLFLISNACWIVYALHFKSMGMFVMQIGFVYTSWTGIQNWLLK